jgi:uncharacterized protein (TIGR02266 family)
MRRPARRFRRRTVRIEVEYVGEAGARTETATTLGAGGLFIESDSPPKTGSSLELRFQLPGSNSVHEIEGRVVWTHRPGDPGRQVSGMGIQFTDKPAIALLAHELETLD